MLSIFIKGITMANLVMESFQIHNKPSDIHILRQSNSRYSKFVSGGRDGHRIAVLSGLGDKDNIARTSSGALFIGFRHFAKYYCCANSGYEPYLQIYGTKSNSIVKFYDGYLYFNSERLLLPSESFLEFGMDEQYIEIRADNKTLTRIVHDNGPAVSAYIYCGNSNYGATTIGIQDLYVNDSSGTTNNSFLGDVKIDAVPVVALSSNNGFSSRNEGPLVDAVKDIPQNPDSWVEGVNIGSKLMFDLDDMPSSDSPLAVKASIYASKLASSDAGLKILAKTGQDTFASEKVALPVTGNHLRSVIFDKSPSGGDWDVSKFNDLEIGVEIVE